MEIEDHIAIKEGDRVAVIRDEHQMSGRFVYRRRRSRYDRFKVIIFVAKKSKRKGEVTLRLEKTIHNDGVHARALIVAQKTGLRVLKNIKHGQRIMSKEEIVMATLAGELSTCVSSPRN